MDRNEDKDKTLKNQERDLPGYPHYPPDEDIMNPQTGFKKISADEEIANSKNLSRLSVKERLDNNEAASGNEEDDIKIVHGTEADVTREDIELLGSRDGDLDLGDDELVQASRVDDVEDEGDLDIPGAELDDESEKLGEEDEENNYYSLGGDRHENLEEDQS